MGFVRACTILVGFILVTLPAMPLQALLIAGRVPPYRHLPHWYHRLVCRLLGVRIHVSGELPASGPVLLVSNHISWLDIPVLSAVTPLSFVAKKEVASWPFISWLAKLQRSVFVDRKRRTTVAQSANEIMERLASRERVLLFAEGTSSDGNQVLPFKSALFAAVEPKDEKGAAPVLQPVAIVYTHVYGLPLNRQQRPSIAWYGDMDMLSHAWNLLKGGPLDVHVRLGEPVSLADTGNRKALAQHAYRNVRLNFSQLLTARPRTAQ